MAPNQELAEASHSLITSALHHLNTLTSNKPTTRSTASNITSPVLVRAYHPPAPSPRHRPQRSTSSSHGALPSSLPPLSAFSFANILQAVSAEADPAIDAIADICARSRTSLANQHAAHLPPTGEIVGLGLASVPEARESAEELSLVPNIAIGATEEPASQRLLARRVGRRNLSLDTAGIDLGGAEVMVSLGSAACDGGVEVRDRGEEHSSSSSGWWSWTGLFAGNRKMPQTAEGRLKLLLKSESIKRPKSAGQLG
ncbi:hypothetical protein M501DRAFT_985105 [Patellaria atrata CBS 101060]|uniref:Uncharacterized protein n=1 Tax=Patellaria atrata CBS 101060 TaxID=1346257 RepID=A0A9P4SI58_9PEZI|nr:hypothetical protein M501DRAFT_985105 [Patellaria atrata CBS 101060]